MECILESTKNTRTILPDSLRYVRSDVPDYITAQETEWLVENNITTLVDLRTNEERAKRKCELAEDNRFRYFCMPVTGGNVVPKTVDDVSKSYINMVDEQMRNIISTIQNAKTNVLFFCNAGKDRTGVVSAILLHSAGMSREYIVDDYMKSKTNLETMLQDFAKRCPEVDIDVITPHERYMQEFLDWLEENGKVNMSLLSKKC
ncbi:MAG: tyrosine-protein phosphatase [Lachnospiraceae bacterium]|nr:tyrosine-protein phosphatase [Lachnospiraceae bacterium]